MYEASDWDAQEYKAKLGKMLDGILVVDPLQAATSVGYGDKLSDLIRHDQSIGAAERRSWSARRIDGDEAQ